MSIKGRDSSTPSFSNDLEIPVLNDEDAMNRLLKLYNEEDDLNMPVLRKQRALPKKENEKRKSKEDDFNITFRTGHWKTEKKGVRRNKNKCDSCRQFGVIYCCDGCSSSYHANCHFPRPDVNKNVPFYCRPCRFARLFSENPEEHNYKNRGLEGEDLCSSIHEACKKLLTAKKQPFVLPKYVVDAAIKMPRVWPNDELINTKRKRLDQDTNCYVCKKTVTHPDYNKCYFCPIVVHLDCQTEPMTSRRIHAWRCECHVENFIDNFMLESSSFVKRTKLYEKYAAHNDDKRETIMDVACKLADHSEDGLTMKTAEILLDLKKMIVVNNGVNNNVSQEMTLVNGTSSNNDGT